MKTPTSDITMRRETRKISKKSHRKPKKRVLSIGEAPRERILKNGKVRHFDLLGKDKTADPIPRKVREFMAGMTRWNLVPTIDESQSDQRTRKEDNRIGDTPGNNVRDDKKNALGSSTGVAQPSRGDEALQQSLKIPASRKRFDGITSGESLSEYSARLRKESQRMAVDIARKGNHQNDKRRAYNKKRREREARRKRRKRGDCSDSDVEDDGTYGEENTQSIGHLPAYWQEIVNNNGRPVSTKKKKRMKRMEKGATTKGTFRDQVDRPPDLSVHPVRRRNNGATKAI